jgi:glucosamine--fructose-6-phosphate aminotransferase (isomerizing)
VSRSDPSRPVTRGDAGGPGGTQRPRGQDASLSPAGSTFLGEIREQPAALARLVAIRERFEHVASEMNERRATTVRMVGHGSSDNAASYGVYAFGLLPRWTALRDSISLTAYYGARLDMAGSTVLALSQSGRTPDVVEYVREAKRGGAFTVAMTNDEDSALTEAADAVHQVAALGLLAACAAGEGPSFAAGLQAVSDMLPALIADTEDAITRVAVPFVYAGRMFVVGRGPEYATARELALKLLETCRVAAEPLTATDLAHGPVAALDSLFPVWAIAADDATLPAVVEAAERAHQAGATVVASGSAASAITVAEFVLPTPPPPSPLLSPLLSIVPCQLFALALARAKGLDPDEPRGLSKVTLAA